MHICCCCKSWDQVCQLQCAITVLLLCMLHTAQIRAPSLALTNTPVAPAQTAKSVADTAVAYQLEVYLKSSKQERQQLNRLLSMPPTYIINACTSP